MPKGIYPRTEKNSLAMSLALKGKPKSPEHRAALSQARIGKYTDAQREARRLITERWRLDGHPSIGTTRSEETKRLQSEMALLRLPSRLVKHGITKEQYQSEKAAGNRWCWFGKHFCPSGQFSVDSLSACDSCKPEAYRVSDLKKNYGVTPEWYDSTLAAQDRKCAICGSDDPRAIRVKKFMVDHVHDETKRVRGLLCHPCNLALGIVEQTPNWTALAQAYLDKYKCSTTIQTAI